MKVELAEKAGFCFGVNRAVDLVYEEAEYGVSPVYTYGPIIHNEEVIRDLEERGVYAVASLEDALQLKEGTMILRSHGVSRAEQESIENTGMHVVDAACPFVKRIHNLVQEYTEKGYQILVIGSPDHPEVMGIVGWGCPEQIQVVASKEDAVNLKVDSENKYCIVSQTTFNSKKFQEIIEIISDKVYNKKGMVGKDYPIIVHNTICSATRERQDAARELAGRVDAMIVIGGASSSNTRKLYEICSEECQNTYFIQTKEDLVNTDFSRFDYVGITAGASTPKNIIEEVQTYVRNEL